MKTNGALGVLVLLAAGMRPGLAEEPAPLVELADAATLAPGLPAEIVVVAARRPQPELEAIGTVSTLERPALDRLQAHDIEDLVRYEPGVTVTGDPARFGLDGFNIRGVEGNRVAIEIDGVPLPSAFSVGRLSRANRDTIEPELIERLEILRGPASTLYGSDALGGIVAITSRAPDDLARPGDPFLGTRLSYTSRDQALRESLLGAWQGETLGALALLVNRDGHETENNAGRAGPAANPASVDQMSGLVRGTADLGRVHASLTVEHYRADVHTNVRSTRLAGGQFANTTLLLADDADERDRAVLALGLAELGPLADALDLSVYWQATSTDQTVLERRRAAPPIARSPIERRRDFSLDSDQIGLELVVQRALQTWALGHHLTYGFEARETVVEERRDGIERNLFTGATTRTVLGETLPVRDFPNADVTEWGVFLADEIRFGESPWALVPGLRYDRYEVDSKPDRTFAADNPGAAIADISDDHVSPKLALRYAASAHDQLFVSYTEGYRTASFADVNIALTIPQFNYVVLPNPALQPERSRGVEAGWNHASERAEWRLAAFANFYRDLIDSRANLGVDASGATIFQSVNRDRARIYGVEAAAGLDLGALTPALDAYALRGAFAWARGDDTRRDLPLNTVQPARLVLELERAATGWVPELALLATIVKEKTRVDRSTSDLFAPPGFVTLDLRARKAWGENVVIDLAIYNLLDKRYWEWGSTRGITNRNVPPPAFFTEPGRHAALTLSLAW